jgi:hypothetical protein
MEATAVVVLTSQLPLWHPVLYHGQMQARQVVAGVASSGSSHPIRHNAMLRWSTRGLMQTPPLEHHSDRLVLRLVPCM